MEASNTTIRGWRPALKRRWIAAVGAGLVASLACGGNPAPASGTGSKTWDISFVSDLSGTQQLYGTSQLGGLQTWVDHVNKTGGVAGGKINLKIRDDKSDTQAGLATFKEALAEKPLIVLGPFVSTLTAAAAPLAEAQGVNDIMWSPVAALMNPPQTHLFAGSVTLDIDAQIQASIVDQIAKSKKQTNLRVVMARLDAASGVDFSNAAQAEAKKRGWTLVGEQKVSLSATDVSDQAAALAKSNADYCMCMVPGAANLQLMRGLRNAGSKMTVVNYFGGGFASDMMSLNDPNYYAMLIFADPNTQNLPAAADLRKQAKDAGQDKYLVGYSFTQGYVEGMVVTQALAKCGSGCTPDKLRASLKSTKYDLGGLAGPTSLDTSQYLFQSGKAFHVVNGQVESLGDWRSAKD